MSHGGGAKSGSCPASTTTVPSGCSIAKLHTESHSVHCLSASVASRRKLSRGWGSTCRRWILTRPVSRTCTLTTRGTFAQADVRRGAGGPDPRPGGVPADAAPSRSSAALRALLHAAGRRVLVLAARALARGVRLRVALAGPDGDRGGRDSAHGERYRRCEQRYVL